ncbi:MAG: hypothetical protein M3541_22730 [Acidobacteriota bacterium]|nr:hypothetical protein [Acidobacteriota bacterium]MDQ3421549.1 hypothetical protein [Acidobacteriota bacterium]
MAVVVTSNLRLVDAPGNVLLPAKASGLPKDSVANVSQVITLDRDFLSERAERLRGRGWTLSERSRRDHERRRRISRVWL